MSRTVIIHKTPRADFYIFLCGGAKLSGGVVMIMWRGRSRVFDDRFTRFTQLIGGSGVKF